MTDLSLPCLVTYFESPLLPIMKSCTLEKIDIFSYHLLSHLAQPTFPSNPLDCGKTSITKFKIKLQKELLQVGEVLLLLAGDISCHNQGPLSDIYDLVHMQHGKVSCLIKVNGDMHLVRDL